MVVQNAVARPPAWKSFLVGFFLFTLILGPAVGMLFYFYRPVTTYFGWYVGTSMLLGIAVGTGLSALVAAVFARNASG